MTPPRKYNHRVAATGAFPGAPVAIRRKILPDKLEVRLLEPFEDRPKGHVFVMLESDLIFKRPPPTEEFFPNNTPFKIRNNTHERGSD